MSDLESRLRTDLRKLADLAQPDTIQPLRDPASAPDRRRRAIRFLAPAAAMLAVAVVAIVVGLILPGLRPGLGPVPSASSLVRNNTVPRYYVLAYQSFGTSGKVATYAAVHSSATGRTLARVTLPTLTDQGGGTSGPTITAAANDRTFVVSESPGTSVHDVLWLFRLQVSNSGRSIKVTRLPVHVPSSVAIDDVALSPDGTRLAMTAQWDCGQRACQHTGIRVVNLATGALTIWSTHVSGAPFNGSWVTNQSVAFEWQPDAVRPAPGYRVLSLTSASRDLFAASQPVASPAVEPNHYLPAALVTPDGQTVVTSEVTPYTRWLVVHGARARIVELNSRTGRVERTLYAASASGQGGILDQSCNVLSLGPGGRHPLVDCFSKLGALINGQIISLPGFPSPSSSGISGQQAIAW